MLVSRHLGIQFIYTRGLFSPILINYKALPCNNNCISEGKGRFSSSIRLSPGNSFVPPPFENWLHGPTILSSPRVRGPDSRRVVQELYLVESREHHISLLLVLIPELFPVPALLALGPNHHLR